MFGLGENPPARRHAATILLIWFLAGPTPAQGPPRESDSKNGVPFELNRTFGAILIRAQVNRHPATLIVDTGSSHTILSPALFEIRPQAWDDAPDAEKGSGLVGTARWAKATVEVGAVTWSDRRVLVMNDFQHLSSSMQERVDGILGEDVLREFSLVIIDYKHNRLVFSQ
jgi:hypothetical protein